MNPDDALIEAWNLGDSQEGWSDSVMEEAERLLPTLIEAGYAEAASGTWNFTERGIARAMELQQTEAEQEA